MLKGIFLLQIVAAVVPGSMVTRPLERPHSLSLP